MKQAENNKSIKDYDKISLPELPYVPGMISEYEAKYLYWLTRQCYTGQGAVVELGTWLGRSSVHLGAGLRDSNHPTTLYCYDLFSWNKYFNAPHLVRQTGFELEHGTDFQPHFEKNVRPVYDNINVTKGPLEHIKWKGEAIEILFVDAPKSQQSICATLESFGSYLIPGVSTIVMQDFLHAPSYSLALVFSELSDELELVHAVPHSSTTVFHVRKPVNIRGNEKRFQIGKWPKDKLMSAWDKVLPYLPSQPREFLELGVAMSLLDIGEVKAACSYMQNIELSNSGEERLSFLRNIPHNYSRYQPIFDCYFDQSIDWFKTTLRKDPKEYQLINGASISKTSDKILLSATKGGIAALDLRRAYRNQVEIEVEVSFPSQSAGTNAFIVFGDQTNCHNRVCVGMYMDTNELWIEEHPGDFFKLQNIRRRFELPKNEVIRTTILVNLDAKTITSLCAGHVIRTTYERYLGEIRWVGYRVYNSETEFGPIRIGGYKHKLVSSE